ncbi:MAG: hypothetical protein H0T57_16950 [Rubrobacter sp.]|nr:hypothetical protein [Rubrobacter sp.]
MATLVGIAISVIVLALFVVNARAGAVAFLLGVLFSPYVTVSGYSLRVELLLIPALLAVLIIKSRPLSLRWPPLNTLYFAWYVWISIATLLGLLGASFIEIEWRDLYTLLRPVLVLFVFYNIAFSASDFYKLAASFVYAAIPLSLLAVGQSYGSKLAETLTLNTYASPARGQIDRLLMDTGAIERGVSVFETAAYSATYFLIAVGTGLFLLLNASMHQGLTSRFLLLMSTAAALIGGVFTLSATFIAGLPLLLAWMLFVSGFANKVRLAGVALVLLLLLYPVMTQLVESNTAAQSWLEHEVDRVSTLSLFETRYDTSYGFVNSTIDAIRDRPLVGWGFANDESVFLGDSLYVVLLYRGGVIGLMLFLGLLAYLGRTSLSKGSMGQMLLLWLFLLLIAGLGGPSFTIPRLQDWWWAMAAILLQSHEVCSAKMGGRPYL